jgi:hypothetical protein
MSCAIDVNILLYAADASSPHHRAAGSFLDACAGGTDVIYLGWPTVMGFLRMATHPAIFDRPLSPEEAVSNMEALIGLPHVKCLSEGDNFWRTYVETVDSVPTRGNLVPDSHLAALLRAHGVRRLYTHDRDFRKYDFLEVLDPIDDRRLPPDDPQT